MLVLQIGSGRAMQVLVVLHDLRIDGLELGLEGRVARGLREAVGATTGLGRVVAVVLEFRDALAAPV